MPKFPLATKCVYDPVAVQDGTRVLVMRFWPRGVSKEKVNFWLRDLGTTPDLITERRTGSISWAQFRRRYRESLQGPAARQAIVEVRKLLANGPVTLLCSCRDEAECHRGILKDVVAQQRSPAKRKSK